MQRTIDIRRMTVTALMAALIFVLTRLVQIPTPARGYIHLGDAGVVFAALAFGPWVGAVAGGLGTALADLTSPYAQWAIFSLVIHGVQGWAVGMFVRRQRTPLTLTLAVIASLVIVAGGYFAAGALLMGVGVALTEVVPNVIQALSGGLIGVPLFAAVGSAYPPLWRYRNRPE